MTAAAIAGTVPAKRSRIEGLDRLRGLAIVLMVGDHCALFLPDGFAYRLTLGRLAMPIFFVLAGYLARRLSPRIAVIAAVGAVMPFAVPFVDSPNVLLWWAAGCVLLALLRRFRVSPALVVIAALGYAANGFAGAWGDTYAPLELFGLMALGQLLPASAWSWTSKLPRWLALPGRYPVQLYVAHLIVLEVVVGLVG